MITEQSKYLGGSYIDPDTKKLMVPTELIVPYKDNPRDPYELDENNDSFKTLTRMILNQPGNHTPVRVYHQNERWHLMVGHRRVEATKMAQRMEEILWEKAGSIGPKPERFNYVYAVQEAPPENDLTLRIQMLQENESSEPWNNVRRFAFFVDTYNLLDEKTKANTKSLRKLFNLRNITLTNYLQLMKYSAVCDVMTDLSEVNFPRKTREFICQQIISCKYNLEQHRPDLVRSMTKKSVDSEEGGNILLDIIVDKAKKYKRYHDIGQLSSGTGTTLKNFISNVVKGKDIEDSVVQEELEHKSYTRNLREKLENAPNKFVYEGEGLLTATVIKMVPTIRNFSEEELLKYADDFERASDYLYDARKRFRDAADKKRRV
tara:strand:+ start:44 stop:1171 length:1128 start_codon:yes stop_codon:yes gene_type:complete